MLIFLILFFTSHAHAGNPVEDERLYGEFRKALTQKSVFRIQPAELGGHKLKLALDAVEDSLAAGRRLPLEKVLHPADTGTLPPQELARWFRLRGTTDEASLIQRLAHVPVSSGLLYELFRLRSLLQTEAGRAFVDKAAEARSADTLTYNALTGRAYTAPSVQEVHDLFSEMPDVAHFQEGAYAGHPRLFLFCRHQRKYPCLFALKDKDDKPVRVGGEGSALWTQPGLAYSGYGLPFNERNGHTPSGVQLINGVMPEANDPVSFGKFRRMVLEFAPPSEGEAEGKRLLPKASENSLWWREAPVARDIGRGELRIHGAGKRNEYPDISFYPFIATEGCVAQRELKYGSTTYIDQRRLLDQMMKASGLEPKFANEPAIKGLLYVIDIDDKASPVTSADLARYGIR